MRYLVYLLFVFISSFAIGSNSLSQAQLADFAAQLDVDYELVNAMPQHCPQQEKQCYLSRLYFKLPYTFSNKQWQIYFSQLMVIYHIESPLFSIEHINGDLHLIKPTEAFSGFEKGKLYTIDFYTRDSQITRSEFMPNYIAVAKGLKPESIASTQTQIDPVTQLETQPYLKPFNSLKQLRVSQQDATPWASSHHLYTTQTRPTLQELTKPSLIPQPSFIETLENEDVNLANGLRFVANDLNVYEAAIERLKKLGVGHSVNGLPVDINIDATLNHNSESKGQTYYELTTLPNGISINAVNQHSVFYALQSISGLIELPKLRIPSVYIKDQPRFDYRGMHIDVARNFRSKQFIFKTIEQMAAYKLNKLHLHLADDEGWRLEIDGLPELTKVGAYRCFDLSETQCLLPQLGAGIDSDSNINGFYNRADYIDIVRYANKHFIDVIPSLDMPGHSRAAIAAMNARYKNYMAQGDSELAYQYWLTEPQDKTHYSSIQHYHDNTLNVCLPATFRFVNKVLDEIKQLHLEAGKPLLTYHIGADETAGAWQQSPACNVLREDPKIASLNGYFIEKVSQQLSSQGLQVAAWSDGLNDTQINSMPSQVHSYVWSTLADGGHKTAHQHANNGWQVVLSVPDVSH